MSLQQLRARKQALESTQEIADLPQYAEDWNVLAAAFEAAGMPANAESCWRRFRHYRDLDLACYAARFVGVTAVTEAVS